MERHIKLMGFHLSEFRLRRAFDIVRDQRGADCTIFLDVTGLDLVCDKLE